MPTFSQFSKDNLSTCDPRLIRLFEAVIRHRDCRVICGHRGEREQNEAFAKGHSKVKWPASKHNALPSLAVDVIPYPFSKHDWKRMDRFALFAGYVIGTGDSMGIRVRWGGDWDCDGYLRDHTFLDGPHFELIE